MNDDIFNQKLTRSSKSLVKTFKKQPIVIDDDDDMENVSTKKARTIVEIHDSPVKANSSMASPMKTSPAKESSPIKSTSPAKKSNFRDFMMRKSAGPIAPGSKEIPEGAPNCLNGLTFVFTGELDSMTRDDASDLVKRYGGRITSAPSGKTSYVVVGRDAGSSKLAKIEALKLKTLDEDGLLALIASSKGQSGSIVDSVQSSPRKTLVSKPKKLPNVTVVHPEIEKYELWTDKYAPQEEAELIGNHSNFVKLVEWLKHWYSPAGSD